MRLFALLQALDTLQTNAPSLDCEVDGIHNDTRRMKAGDMFVAITGTDRDGHEYIDKALELGASMIVSERPLDLSVPHVVVPDSRIALAKLAACMYGTPASKLTMVGVTGTKGKTTVTHLIKGLIEGVAGGKTGLIGTNHILIGDKELPAERTTPDAVALHGVFAEMAAQSCTHCVMEVSSHALAQYRTLGIQYESAVFTNLNHEHLDYHNNMEDYFAAKRRLFDQCNKAAVNIDDPWGQRLFEELTGASAYTCEGKDANRVFSASNIKLLRDGVSFDITGDGETVAVRGRTPGMFSVRNILAAFAAGADLGFPLADMARVDIPPVMGRMEVVPDTGGVCVIIDYAHTPDAMENALSTARRFTKGRLLAVFGCGGDRDRAKRPMMGAAAEKYADLCFVTSDNPRTEEPAAIIEEILTGMSSPYHIEPDRRAAIRTALNTAKEGDTVLLLGKGHETYQEINGVKHHMDEREIVAEYYR